MCLLCQFVVNVACILFGFLSGEFHEKSSKDFGIILNTFVTFLSLVLPNEGTFSRLPQVFRIPRIWSNKRLPDLYCNVSWFKVVLERESFLCGMVTAAPLELCAHAKNRLSAASWHSTFIKRSFHG